MHKSSKDGLFLLDRVYPVSKSTCLFLYDTDPFHLGYIDAADFYETGYKRILPTQGQLVQMGRHQ